MLSAYFVVYVHILAIFFLFLPLLLSRMQKLAQQQNEKIETVNRERKFHQVILISNTPHPTLIWCNLVIKLISILIHLTDQQNTAYELNALSAQWKELCLKNIEIHAACSHIENHIEELRREAAERYLPFRVGVHFAY